MPKAKESERGYEKIDAVIEDAEVRSVYDLWKRKPKGLGFEDTNAVVVKAKTSDGKKVIETFYIALKPDGTFNVPTLSKRSQARREKFARFLRHYKITDNIKDYNIPERIEEWKGKKVKVVPYAGSGYIFIP